ncbi:hypothetical protein DSO57_1021074 [Entomophthora muscae]|uniref:Uncharacterized protein n=1 Tax=Entomophthora muscae TaxID=34485 RepID=A0ACC2SSD0_9FUNG|nr:hypothetical protein DSO57_1021074 [Entomophthora muscae]
MTPPLTPQPNCPMETPTAAETTSTQLFGLLYITLTGMVDTMVPNSGPWSLLGQSVIYIIKLVPILWWALPAGPAVPHPESPNASTYAWLPETFPGNNNNGMNHKPLGSNGHRNRNKGQSNCTHLRVITTQDNQDKGKAQRKH